MHFIPKKAKGFRQVGWGQRASREVGERPAAAPTAGMTRQLATQWAALVATEERDPTFLRALREGLTARHFKPVVLESDLQWPAEKDDYWRYAVIHSAYNAAKLKVWFHPRSR